MRTIGELPAGQYYIGDPCYVIRDDSAWDAFCNALYAAEKQAGKENEAVVFEHLGHKCFASPTNIGDGCYRDQYGNEYPVDAGMIAAVPVALFGGRIGREFKKAFKVKVTPGRWLDRGKRINIGGYSIRT